MNELCLPASYRSRAANNVNLAVTDGAQRRVYRHAANIAKRDPTIRTVLDWGCGSGAKLIEYFGRLDTLGVDVDYRLETLQSRFPARRWGVVPVTIDADLVLCVDVIEHLEDPLELFRRFAAGRWKHLVISTPERELVAKHKCRSKRSRRQQRSGPPCNRWHTREWNAAEFAQLCIRQLRVEPVMCVLGRWNMVAHLSKHRTAPPAPIG